MYHVWFVLYVFDVLHVLWYGGTHWILVFIFFFQAEDGIRDLVRSRGLGDVYKRQESWVPGCDQRHRLVGAVLQDSTLHVDRPARPLGRLSLIHI